METATQHDYLKENADNIWFVLGAYFFAFFPWAIMNNIDFISEKWRTCRRTRDLALKHLASYILPIIYVAVYAEAQRRKEDNKEFAAALTALMFNVYQLMRTIMGWIQLNAFVAWCKHAVECVRVLEGYNDETSSSSSKRTEEGARDKTRRMMELLGQWQKVFVSRCKRGSHRMRELLQRDGESSVRRRNRDERNRESSVSVNMNENDVDGAEETIHVLSGINGENRNAEADADSNRNRSSESLERTAESRDDGNESNEESKVGRGNEDDGNEIENKIMVNNMVVDNELGGTEVMVIPSWKKIWSGVKRGRFTPSRWLRTDQVILNTIRWSGAYLCGMGNPWSVDKFRDSFLNECDEIFDTFFSREMFYVRRSLQEVEWDMSEENDDRELFCICPSESSGIVELFGERSTAYGNRLPSYDVKEPFTVETYSFEFNSLVGSYPHDGEIHDGDTYITTNRERIRVELVHSVLLAKDLGLAKLQAIRHYYDRYRVPEGAILRNAIELLLKQSNTPISDEAKIWNMFDSSEYDIPIFPYRMQMVALWEEATNRRVLQVSGRWDIRSSLDPRGYFELQNENEQWILRNAPSPLNIFDYCAKWISERRNVEPKGSLCVLLETVRTFLAEWITASAQEANWEPEIPTTCVEFKTTENEAERDAHYLIWMCQRELQRIVAKMPKEEEKFSGNAALIMLFILGFPLLQIDEPQEPEVRGQDGRDNAHEGRVSSPSNTTRTIELSVEVRRAWTPLAPQHISLVIQIDKRNRTASLRLENNSGDTRFIWQKWVDAAMGCMKGFEEGKDGKKGYGRKIVKAELRKPMVELCPLRVIDDGMGTTVETTRTARVWMGWPVFDVRICKFEVDQWVDACNIDVGDWLDYEEIECFEGVIEEMISTVNEEAEAPKQCGDVYQGIGCTASGDH